MLRKRNPASRLSFARISKQKTYKSFPFTLLCERYEINPLESHSYAKRRGVGATLWKSYDGRRRVEMFARNLLVAGPVRGRERDMPEIRRWLLELHGYLCRARQLPLRSHHPAFLLFPAQHVLQDKPLLRRHVCCQGHQGPVRAHDQSVRALIERWPLPGHPVNNNRHAHRQTLAPPLASPPSSGSRRRFPHGTFSIAPIRPRERPHSALVPNQIRLPVGSGKCPISRQPNATPGQKPMPRSLNSILRPFPRTTCSGLALALRLPFQSPRRRPRPPRHDESFRPVLHHQAQRHRHRPGPEPPDRRSSRRLFASRKPQESARLPRPPPPSL
jgi:hypothetical protein